MEFQNMEEDFPIIPVFPVQSADLWVTRKSNRIMQFELRLNQKS